ncbi:unnamed protein product [Chironomus riparius]|uniref:Uncharacterized protein n=1 Tax=Chironomus riparius TaxID=315576 RepID=A0A9N9RXS1_9DIPT|nr:unnamed protein product [Chironomus riparius]
MDDVLSWVLKAGLKMNSNLLVIVIFGIIICPNIHRSLQILLIKCIWNMHKIHLKLINYPEITMSLLDLSLLRNVLHDASPELGFTAIPSSGILTILCLKSTIVKEILESIKRLNLHNNLIIGIEHEKVKIMYRTIVSKVVTIEQFITRLRGLSSKWVVKSIKNNSSRQSVITFLVNSEGHNIIRANNNKLWFKGSEISVELVKSVRLLIMTYDGIDYEEPEYLKLVSRFITFLTCFFIYFMF